MTTRTKWIVGVLVVLVLVVVVVLVVVSTSSSPAPRRPLVRVSGTRPPDAVFTPDSAGRYPGEAGWVDEGADVEVG